MLFLKNMFLWIFVVIHTAFFSSAGIILALIDPSGRLTHYYSAKPWGRWILWAGRVKVSVEGLDHIQKGVPYILMPNHQSFFDIFGLLAYMPLDFKFILKKELLSIPLLGYCMKRAGYIAIDRRDSRRAIKSLDEAVLKIQRGASVLIFPEGTRSPDGILQDFKKGGFHLALKAGCTILPIGISNSHKIMSKGSILIRRGSFLIRVGQPIPVGAYHKGEVGSLMERVRLAIVDLMGEGTASGIVPSQTSSGS